MKKEEIEELKQLGRDYLWIHAHQWDEVGEEFIFVEGSGCRITDVNGRTFIETRSGYTGANVGYGRKEIAEAVSAAIVDRCTFAPTGCTTPLAIKYSAKIVEIAPGSLSKASRAYLCNSGSEANETAIRIARAYHDRMGFPRKHKVISRYGSYHGWSSGVMTVGRVKVLPIGIEEPGVPGRLCVPPVYCYRCPYGLEYPNCDLQCAKAIEQVIEWEGPDSVAAVLGESISAAAGGTLPPPEYWSIVRAACDKYNVTLIDDEVVCGFGRTGNMWGCETCGFTPDIVAMAKGTTGLHVPLGVTVVKKEMADKFIGKGVAPHIQIVTFAGVPASCAAGLATIEIMEKEKVVENCAKMGSYLNDQLQALKEKRLMIGDIRGIGLLQFIEFVKDRKTKEPFSKEDNLSMKYKAKCYERGLIGEIYTNIAAGITPPLIVTKSDIDEIVNILDEVIGEMEKEYGMA